MRRSFALIAVVVALVVTACNDTDRGTASTVDDGNGSGSTQGSRGAAAGSRGASASGVRAMQASLQQFDRCDTLLGWIRTEAAERVGPYGFDGGGFYVGMDDVEDVADAEVPAAEPRSETAAGSDGSFSTTNVQEAGVDEPDIVKTDGERLFVLAGDTLHVVDAAPSAPRVLDSLRVGSDEGHPMELLLGDDRLYVVSSVWGAPWQPGDRDGMASDGPAGDDLVAEDVIERSPWVEYASVVITEVTVSGDGRLSESDRLEISGGYVTARQIGDGVRLVIRDTPQSRLPFVFPSGPDAEGDAETHNRDMVANSDLEDWLPRYRLTTANGQERTGSLTECDRVTAPQEFSGMSTVSVLTLTMGEPLGTGNAMTLFGSADTVYASHESLYAATYAFPEVWPLAEDTGSDPDPEFATQIHRFDITDPRGANYLASGAVRGRLLNQFALSEHDGHLRVATTEGSPWFCCGEDTISSSSVVVLRTDGDDLIEVGSVGDLGIGESIFGVRFVGDRGYVVTFRQTDPLYVVDLSDPAAPSVDGELKITGYSSYLHPVSEGLVLGVGQEATEEGMTTGTKVSLFDVSNPADPREVDRWILDNSSSPVEWDHRAFLYWASEDLAIVPVQVWGNERFGAVALAVSGGTIEERARLVQSTAGGNELNSACTVIEPDDPSRDSELFWILQEGATIVQCPTSEPPARGGFWCEPMSSWGIGEGELAEIGDDIASEDTIDICWPDYDEGRDITRSVVIGDTLWTVGHSAVQANDLATLEPIASVDF